MNLLTDIVNFIWCVMSGVEDGEVLNSMGLTGVGGVLGEWERCRVMGEFCVGDWRSCTRKSV